MWTHSDILWELAKQHTDEVACQAEKRRVLAAARRHRTGHPRGQR
jgi:hypothetical protein